MIITIGDKTTTHLRAAKLGAAGANLTFTGNLAKYDLWLEIQMKRLLEEGWDVTVDGPNINYTVTAEQYKATQTTHSWFQAWCAQNNLPTGS